MHVNALHITKSTGSSFSQLIGIPALFLCNKMTQSLNTILIARLADLSEHTGLLVKTQELEMYSKSKIMCFWNIEACESILEDPNNDLFM